MSIDRTHPQSEAENELLQHVAPTGHRESGAPPVPATHCDGHGDAWAGVWVNSTDATAEQISAIAVVAMLGSSGLNFPQSVLQLKITKLPQHLLVLILIVLFPFYCSVF